MKHLLSSADLNRDQLEALFDRAAGYLPVVQERRSVEDAKGKILATLFFEPSTRTRFSFESAMLRLGGAVISNAQMKETSSAKKGESLMDTGRTVSEMADVIAMRHPEAGSVAALAEGSLVPVLNAGDGAADHPTQGLLDLFTMRQEFGKLDGLTVAMVGDLKYGRVPHAQCELLSNYEGVKFIFVTPEGLEMPREIVEKLEAKGFEVVEGESLDLMAEADVIGFTRVQGERFESEAEYLKYKGVYVMTPELMSTLKDTAILMHPLPRVDEISVEVDGDSRAKYFDQIRNGVALRMALLATVLEL